MGKRAIGAVLFLAGLMSVTAAAAFFQQAGSGMIGFWRFEETAGPTAADSSGGGNPGAWTGTVTSLPGPANTASQLGANSTACYNFNGTDAYVSVPHTPALTITGDFTVALWIYKNAEATDWVRLVGKGDSATRTFGVWEESGGTRILFQQYNGSGGAVISYFSNGNVPLTTWTHVACRVSGNNASIFLNGANSGNSTRSGPPGTDTTPLTIGYAPGIHTFWNGRIDDVRLYNRALTDPEIAAIGAGGQGPPAPTGLTAVAGNNQVQLTWSGSGVVYNVKRSTTAGGPYTTLMSNVATNSYTDSAVTNGTTYYYVVSGVTYGEGPNSNEATATPLPVTALPNTGLFTSEAGLATSFTIKFNSPAPAGCTVRVVSNNLGEGVVTTTDPTATAYPPSPAVRTGFEIIVPVGTSPSIPVTVTGVDDPFADGNTVYTVSVTATNVVNPIPNVTITNTDNDTPGITFSRTSGLITTESGGTDSFAVALQTRPNGNVTLNLSSSNPLEGTVSPSVIVFNNLNYTGVPVTVTGVDDTALDFIQYYTILSSPLSAPSDPPYAGMIPPTVSVGNLDNEVVPPAPGAWGGCGLLGAEVALLLLLRRFRRPRA